MEGKIYGCDRQNSSGSFPYWIRHQCNLVRIDKDGQKDLIVSLEWGGIEAFINHKGVFEKKELTDKKGWWNFILPVDLNNDGQIDLVAGNLGLNSRLKAQNRNLFVYIIMILTAMGKRTRSYLIIWTGGNCLLQIKMNWKNRCLF